MITVTEVELREAIKLLQEIDGDPQHPVNDTRHPEHDECLKAYQEIEVWIVNSTDLLNKFQKT